MAENDPTFVESVFAARDWARSKVAPYVTWLPDGLEPYAADIGTGLVLLGALVALARTGADIWKATTRAPRNLWRLATGRKAPNSEDVIADKVLGGLKMLFAMRSPNRQKKQRRRARSFQRTQ